VEITNELAVFQRGQIFDSDPAPPRQVTPGSMEKTVPEARTSWSWAEAWVFMFGQPDTMSSEWPNLSP